MGKSKTTMPDNASDAKAERTPQKLKSSLKTREQDSSKAQQEQEVTSTSELRPQKEAKAKSSDDSDVPSSSKTDETKAKLKKEKKDKENATEDADISKSDEPRSRSSTVDPSETKDAETKSKKSSKDKKRKEEETATSSVHFEDLEKRSKAGRESKATKKEQSEGKEVSTKPQKSQESNGISKPDAKEPRSRSSTIEPPPSKATEKVTRDRAPKVDPAHPSSSKKEVRIPKKEAKSPEPVGKSNKLDVQSTSHKGKERASDDFIPKSKAASSSKSDNKHVLTMPATKSKSSISKPSSIPVSRPKTMPKSNGAPKAISPTPLVPATVNIRDGSMIPIMKKKKSARQVLQKMSHHALRMSELAQRYKVIRSTTPQKPATAAATIRSSTVSPIPTNEPAIAIEEFSLAELRAEYEKQKTQKVALRLQNDDLQQQVTTLNKKLVKEQEKGKLFPKVTTTVPTSLEANIHLKYQYQKIIEAEREKYALLEKENQRLVNEMKGLEIKHLKDKKALSQDERASHVNEIVIWKAKVKDLEAEIEKLGSQIISLEKAIEREVKEKEKLNKELVIMKALQIHVSDQLDLDGVKQGPVLNEYTVAESAPVKVVKSSVKPTTRTASVKPKDMKRNPSTTEKTAEESGKAPYQAQLSDNDNTEPTSIHLENDNRGLQMNEIGKIDELDEPEESHLKKETVHRSQKIEPIVEQKPESFQINFNTGDEGLNVEISKPKKPRSQKIEPIVEQKPESFQVRVNTGDEGLNVEISKPKKPAKRKPVNDKNSSSEPGIEASSVENSDSVAVSISTKDDDSALKLQMFQADSIKQNNHSEDQVPNNKMSNELNSIDPDIDNQSRRKSKSEAPSQKESDTRKPRRRIKSHNTEPTNSSGSDEPPMATEDAIAPLPEEESLMRRKNRHHRRTSSMVSEEDTIKAAKIQLEYDAYVAKK